MKLHLEGAPDIRATPEAVWDRLVDPEFVARSAPGTERVEILGPDRFRLELGFGVAFLKLGFTMDVHMHDLVPPEHASLTATGSAHGTTATVRSKVRIETLGPERQRLHWRAEGEVDGALANLGAPLVEAALRAMSRDFGEDCARRVSEEHAAR